MYLLNLAQYMGIGTLLMGVSTPPKLCKMFLYVSETSQNKLVYGVLLEAEILPYPMYIVNLAQC